MIEFIRNILITIKTNEWFLFEIYVIFVWFIMLPRALFAFLNYQREKKSRKMANTLIPKYQATVLLTIFQEEKDILEKCMKGVKESLEISCSKYAFIAMIDGWSPNQKESEQFKIANQYADIVLGTDARNKRKNLRALIEYARKYEMLYEFTIFLDSDTIPKDQYTIQHLLKRFSDEKIGGITSAQYIYRPKTLIQKISAWLEDARLKSSMAATSYFYQVPCLPGRMYAVRTKLIEHRMDELVNDTFSYFGKLKRACVAGDDRMITNFILQSGYRTILAYDAIIYTLAPKEISKTFKMWTRWGRSSQGYTIRSPWLIKYPFAFFVCWSDILLCLSTVYIIAFHWPYMILHGQSDLVLWQSLIIALVGMALTMFIRQLPHLKSHPQDLRLLLLFSLIATCAQFIRFWSLCTQHRIGLWATREGSDEQQKNDTVLMLKKPLSIEPLISTYVINVPHEEKVEEQAVELTT